MMHEPQLVDELRGLETEVAQLRVQLVDANAETDKVQSTSASASSLKSQKLDDDRNPVIHNSSVLLHKVR